jgi:hypothetical protein
MRQKSIALSCALTFAILPGCTSTGGDDGGGDNPPDAGQSPDAGQPPDAGPPPPDGSTVGPVDMTGAIQKGPFVIGSNVELAILDPATANPTGESFSTLTRNDLGEFDVTLPGTGAAEIQTTGFYFNEIAGYPSAAPITMRALAYFPYSGPRSVHVNALTHLGHLRAKKLVGEGMDFEAAIAQAETELRAALPLATSLDVAAGTELDILGGDNEDNAYLFALSCVLAQTALDEGAGSPDAELQEQMTLIALDLEDDGILAADRVDTLKRGARLLDGDRCTANMEKFVADKGSSAVIPDIRRALDFDLDGTADRTDTDADGDGRLAADDAIVQVAGGGGRTIYMAIDEGGMVWSWGGGGPFGGSITECDASASGYGCPALPATGLLDEFGAARAAVSGGDDVGGGTAILLDDGRIVAFDRFSPGPRLVTGASNMIALRNTGYASRGVVYAIRNDGTVWKIENGAATQRTGITQARTVAEYNGGGTGALWVLHTDGTIRGYDNDSTATYTVNGLPDVVELAINEVNVEFGYAVDGDGGLWRWSPRDAITNGSATATQVSMSGPVISLAPDGMHAALEDGTVWRLTAQVPFVLPDLSDVVRVSDTVAILRDGSVVTFSGSYESTGEPVPVYIPR